MKVQDVGRGPASVSRACIVLQTSPPKEDAILGVQPEPPYPRISTCLAARVPLLLRGCSVQWKPQTTGETAGSQNVGKAHVSTGGAARGLVHEPQHGSS